MTRKSNEGILEPDTNSWYEGIRITVACDDKILAAKNILWSQVING